VHAIRLDVVPEMSATAGAFVTAACDTGMVNQLWVEAGGVQLPPSHALHCTEEGIRRE
jgi:hypothetical protein